MISRFSIAIENCKFWDLLKCFEPFFNLIKHMKLQPTGRFSGVDKCNIVAGFLPSSRDFDIELFEHNRFIASQTLDRVCRVFLFIFHFWRIIRFIRVFVQLKQPVVCYRRDSPLFLAFFPSLEFCIKSENFRKNTFIIRFVK